MYHPFINLYTLYSNFRTDYWGVGVTNDIKVAAKDKYQKTLDHQPLINLYSNYTVEWMQFSKKSYVIPGSKVHGVNFMLYW